VGEGVPVELPSRSSRRLLAHRPLEQRRGSCPCRRGFEVPTVGSTAGLPTQDQPQPNPLCGPVELLDRSRRPWRVEPAFRRAVVTRWRLGPPRLAHGAW
jgi:hypothetical protein